METLCPRCGSRLEYSRQPPRFCSDCGAPLSSAPADQPTRDYGLGEPGASAPGADRIPSAIGGYRLLKALGSGGMGTVYEAEQPGSGRRVALKVIRPEFADSPDAVERFRREGRLASSLSHPRCVFVLAADEEAGVPYIVMELMPGRTLADALAEGGPMPVGMAVRYVLDAIEGLGEAHQGG
ncbi:MAG: protein kinase, partial [Gemmataceae bacterium]|nr:protein kinase [Gemmataceae bacterium]